MRQVQLGANGPQVSRVGLGCNNFGGRIDLAATRAVVDAALDAGATHFDTADVYGERGGSERLLGEILEGRRDRVFLATKFGNDMGLDEGMPRGSREYVHRAVERSLERLRTDRIDLYYYHRPQEGMSVGDTVAAMTELVSAGKVRYLGCSNLTAEQLREAAKAGGVHLVALQNQYSLLRRDAEEDVLPLCRELGIGFVPYFPLASGLLTGKYRRGRPPPPGSRLEDVPDRLTDAKFDRIEALERFAAGRGRTLLEVAVAGLASQAGVGSVIAGATKAEQVRANAAAGEWELDDDDLAALAGLR